MQSIEIIHEGSERVPASDSTKRERVHATEVSFRSQGAYQMAGKQAAPVQALLKPNGAPVPLASDDLQRTEKKMPDWEKDAETGQWLQRTVKRRDAEPEVHQRTAATVQAKTLKMATSVNQTNIQVVGQNDVAVPVRVLYVKPQVVKREKKAEPENLTVQVRPMLGKAGSKAGLTDRSIENALFDVSGMFKRKKVSEAEKRAEAKRAYAEKVRQENKEKLKKPQLHRNDLHAEVVAQIDQIDQRLNDLQWHLNTSPEYDFGQLAADTHDSQEAFIEQRRQKVMDEMAELQAMKGRLAALPPGKVPDEVANASSFVPTSVEDDSWRDRLPHTKNRFKGQMSQLNLIERARQKVLQERLEADEQKRLEAEKKEREKAFLDELAERNRQRVNTGERVEVGKEGILKRREKEMKERQQFAELQEMRDQRRALREKRHAEGRGVALGLDQASRGKMRRLQEQKMQQDRLRKLEVREKAMAAYIEREQAAEDERQRSIDAKVTLEREQIEDDEAQPVVDRAAILRQQREKRRIAEARKAQEEQDRQSKKAANLKILSDTARRIALESREAVLAKQRASTDRSRLKRARKATAYATTGTLDSDGQPKRGRSEQLADLGSWIDGQIRATSTERPVSQEKKKAKSTIGSGSRPRESSISVEGYDARAEKDKSRIQLMDPTLTKHALPGNDLVPAEFERATKGRKNRYGVDGDNGYSDLVERRLESEGYTMPQQDNILDFTKEGAPSPPKDASFFKPPVAQGPRKIINAPVPAAALSPNRRRREQPPGLTSVREEASRQKKAEDERRHRAAVEIQRRARGWRDRKRTKAQMYSMKAEIEADHADFIAKYKAYDSYNLDRFLGERKKLRALSGTEEIEESIQERIADSGSLPQAIDDPSSRALQQLFYRPQRKAMEHDPHSLIGLYAQRHAPPAPKIEQPRGDLRKKRSKAGRRESQKSRSGRKRRSEVDESIEEDLPAHASSSARIGTDEIAEEIDDKYDSDYSEDIVESISADKSPLGKKFDSSYAMGASKKQSSSGVIDESIPESIQPGSSSRDRLRRMRRESPSKEESIKEESITEEENLKKEFGQTLDEDDIVDEAPLVADDGPSDSYSQIEEESAIKSRVGQVRESIASDYDRQGMVDLSGPLRAQRARDERRMREEIRLKEQEDAYRNSAQIIEDFEREHKLKDGGKGSAHDKLLTGLAEELKRYEAAVSGQIFSEQLTGIVNKSLARKDVLILGQRLSQLEAENRHKQEIADIRAEQIRMLSQMMMLQAGQGAGTGVVPEQLKKQQQELMSNIQAVIEAPMPQAQPTDIVGESVASRRSAAVLLGPGRMPGPSQSGAKYSSIAESIPTGTDETAKRGGGSGSEEDEIVDEIGPLTNDGGMIEDSIKESIALPNVDESGKQLSHMRAVLGSEQSIKGMGRDIINGGANAAKATVGPFNKSSFQDYRADKFKSMLVAEQADGMAAYLGEIENAVVTKQEKETQILQRQLDSRKISPRTFRSRKNELERWVSQERQELTSKRRQVERAVKDVQGFVSRLEQDRKITLDAVLNASPGDQRQQSRRQASDLASSDSYQLRKAKEQLQGLQAGHGEAKPEARYLNKKREFVRQLLNEKREAIERGVASELTLLEGEMIDDMMQTALNLDVDAEIARRVELARQMAEETQKTGDSLSKSLGGPKRHSLPIDESAAGPSAVSKSGSMDRRKRVQFLREEEERKQSLQKSGKKDSMAEDSIGESIQEASFRESSIASNIDESRRSRLSASGKQEKRNQQKAAPGNLDEIKEAASSDSLDRDPAHGDGTLQADVDRSVEKRSPSTAGKGAADDRSATYTEDFIAESIASGSSETKDLKSASILQSKVEDSAGYSEAFEEISQSHNLTAKPNLKPAPIEPVKEEDSAFIHSSEAGASDAQVSASLDDKEVPLESARTVEWQFVLQDRLLPRSDDSSDAIHASQAVSDAHSGSPYPSEGADEMLADNITDQLIADILGDFVRQPMRMAVGDEIDEAAYEDKWPFNLERKAAEAEALRQQQAKDEEAQALAMQEEERKRLEAESKRAEVESKERHDAQIQKAQDIIEDIEAARRQTAEYLDFVVANVDPELLIQALQRPIEHDPLKVLEQIQAFDVDEQSVENTAMTVSQQQAVLPAHMFDELERVFTGRDEEALNVTQTTGGIQHLAIFDAFNEALDRERPYKVHGLPNPWSKATRLTNEAITVAQVNQIVERAKKHVLEWNKTGAGTRYAPPPPPPPVNMDGDMPPPQMNDDTEEERNKFERQERLGHLLTAEVHDKEGEWLDYEKEDTQVRFDVADMILEELADECTGFLVQKLEPGLALEAGPNQMDDY